MNSKPAQEGDADRPYLVAAHATLADRGTSRHDDWRARFGSNVIPKLSPKYRVIAPDLRG